MTNLCLDLGFKDAEHVERMHALGLGCLVCGRQEVEFHHTLHNRLSTQKQTDHAGLMLCNKHHQYLHYSGKGGAEFFYWMMSKDLVNDYDQHIERIRLYSRHFQKGSDITFALKQAAFLFAIQSFKMDDLDLIQSYRATQRHNRLLFKKRLFRENITQDIANIQRFITL